MTILTKIFPSIKHVILLLCSLSFLHVGANNSTQLSGNIIYFDRSNEQTNRPQNVFDDNTNTYFQSNPPSTGNWVGLDLGSRHVITKIAFAPCAKESRYLERLQLGIFEGANNEDFGDAIALHIIPGKVNQGMNEVEINCTKGFRYVRFIFPVQHENLSSYMAELKFYGYEEFGNESQLPQLTNLPTVSIHTVNRQEIDSKETYVKGIISIIYANGTKMQTDSVEIRGRGNMSWTFPKKPYRIKLANSTRLMNLPAKARNWTLINNYGDKTLMRNILAFDFSRRVEMPYTSPAEAVDVVINGDYKGCYQLCDHIDIRENRVDIEEMTATDLTGGYMIEIDAYADQEIKWFTSNHYSIPVTIKYPDADEITSQQENYIKTQFNSLTSSVNNSQFKDPVNGFRKYMDTETFLKHFLVNEYAGNTDTYWSVRMTKKRDEDKFYFGPVWDFDLGFDNDNRTYPVQNINNWLALSNQSSAAGNCKDMVNRILSDSEMTNELKEIYSYYRDRNIISKEVLLNVVDSCVQFLTQSQELNFKRWPIMNTYVHQNPAIHGSYEAEVNNVKNYVSKRVDWIDNKLNYVPTTIIGNTDTKYQLLQALSKHDAIHLVNVTEPCHYKITDITGKIISTGKTSTDTSVNVGKGAYIVIVSNETTRQVIKCIVK